MTKQVRIDPGTNRERISKQPDRQMDRNRLESSLGRAWDPEVETDNLETKDRHWHKREREEELGKD